jgi:ribosome-associated heat shock protein Hsp15
MPDEAQRVDKWLWFARVVKTRCLAARLVTDGRVRVNTLKISTPAKKIKPGDTLTVALERQVRVLKVIGSGTRRGGASEAQRLFEDLSTSAPAQSSSPR